jgi:foldase protein PrsA
LNKKLTIIIPVVVVAVVIVLSIVGVYTWFSSSDYVAKVGGEKITKTQYTVFLDNVKSQLSQYVQITDWKTQNIAGQNAEQYAKKQALDSVIQFKICLMKAKDANFKLSAKDDTDFNTNFDGSVSAAQGGKAAVEKQIKDRLNITLAQYKAIQKDNVLVSNYIKSLQDKFTITDAEIKKYYDDNKDSVDKVTVDHILFSTVDANNQPLSQDKQDAAKKSAEEVLAKAKAPGADFAALVKQYTEDTGSKDTGGEYTINKNGQTVAEFEDWAFKANASTPIEIVKSQFGYHIMKFVKRFTFDELKADILTKIKDQKFSAEFDKWKTDPKYTVVNNQKVIDTVAIQ